MYKKVCIIAGEASGDNFGAKIIANLKKDNPEMKFIGIGGGNMIKTGLKSIIAMHKLSIMGFIEVIPKIPEMLYLLHKVYKYILSEQPDLIITIDSPGFCFRLIKKLQSLRPQTRMVHIVAPSVWAYKPERAQKIAKLYDMLGCFLYFEPEYFEVHGLKSFFIGHPVTEYNFDHNVHLEQFKQDYNIDKDDTILLAMPGSRVNEIKKLWPVYLETFKLLKKQKRNLKILVPIDINLRDLVQNYSFDSSYVKIISHYQKNNCFKLADFALIKSGTSSLEVAWNKIPMVVVYKVNKISEIIFKMLSDIKFVSLINIIGNKSIIPEFLQDQCKAENISQKLLEVFDHREEQINEVQPILSHLENNQNISPSNYFCKLLKDNF